MLNVKLVGIERTESKIDNLKAVITSALQTAIPEALLEIAGYIKSPNLTGGVLNRRTGTLQSSILTEMLPTTGTKVAGRVYQDSSIAPYGKMLNDGTKPHVIEAVKGKALRFEIGGKVFYRRKVNHPGTTAADFFYSAMEARRQIVNDNINDAIREAIKQSWV